MLFFNFSAAKESNNFYLCNTFFQNFFLSKIEKKVGKLPVSHRYNRLPLLPSDSGGFQQELIAQDLPGAKVEKFTLQPNKKYRPRNFMLFALTNSAGNNNNYLSTSIKNETIHKK